MMLHRHFEEAKTNKNLTKSTDLGPDAKAEKEEFVSEVFPPEKPEPKRTTRKKAVKG